MSGWIVDAVVASALLMILVLLVRGPVRRAFGPSVAYALWALPPLRFATPPLPGEWRVAAAPITEAGAFVAGLAVPADPPPTGIATGPISWAAIGAGVWAVGALAFLLAHLLAHRRHRAALLREHRPVERVGGVSVVLSPAASGPLAFGVLSRYVVLPADLDLRYDEEERALALAHELGHHARGDLLANWAALAVLAVHWWNPVAWAAHRAFRTDQELANDARVLRGRGAAAAHAYARAILKTAGGRALAAECRLHTISDLKGRLRMLKNRPASPRRMAAGAASVSLMVLAALGLTASGTRAAAAARATVGEAVGVDLDAELDQLLADMPAPPPTPIAPRAPVPPAPSAAPAPATPLTRQVAPVPPVPATPPAPAGLGDRHVWVTTDGEGRTVRVVRLGPNARASDPARIAAISPRRCGGDARPFVRRLERDGKRIVIICTDRIERSAERRSLDARLRAELAARAERWARGAQRGALVAEDGRAIERDALRNALEGLRGARRAIESNPQLTPEQRRSALVGVERGEREIRQSIARGD